MNKPEDAASVLNLLVLDEDTSPYEAINQSSLGNDLGLYFTQPDDEAFTVIQNNNIHALIIDLDKDEAQGRKWIDRLKKFDPLREKSVLGSKNPNNNLYQKLKVPNSGSRGGSEPMSRMRLCVTGCSTESIWLVRKPVEVAPPQTREDLYETIMEKKKGRLGK